VIWINLDTWPTRYCCIIWNDDHTNDMETDMTNLLLPGGLW